MKESVNDRKKNVQFDKWISAITVSSHSSKGYDKNNLEYIYLYFEWKGCECRAANSCEY